MELETKSSIVRTRRSLRPSPCALGRMINSTLQHNIATNAASGGALWNNGALVTDPLTRMMNNQPSQTCGAGYYIIAVSGVSASCSPCFPGTFQPESGHFGCLPCPSGTYRPSPSGSFWRTGSVPTSFDLQARIQSPIAEREVRLPIAI